MTVLDLTLLMIWLTAALGLFIGYRHQVRNAARLLVVDNVPRQGEIDPGRHDSKKMVPAQDRRRRALEMTWVEACMLWMI